MPRINSLDVKEVTRNLRAALAELAPVLEQLERETAGSEWPAQPFTMARGFVLRAMACLDTVETFAPDGAL